MKTSNTFETEWVASKPVYYNVRTGAASHSIMDVVEPKRIALHPEGFNNYLEFGYSVFGQTPLTDIKYLPHSSKLITHADGKISIESNPDIAESYIGKETTEETALEHFAESIRQWEASFSEEIILPLSGGFDSRLLNHFITDKSRVRAFTYGTSERQSWSFEVINARNLACNLHEQWEQIPLNNFMSQLPAWEALYGPATHAHGMYQIEFYEKVRARVGKGAQIISGIIGDAWAGSVKIPEINNPNSLSPLGYSHGMHADPKQSLLAGNSELRNEYWKNHKTKLSDPRWRVLESMRFKMTLLSYLLTVPTHLGLPAWSPFTDPAVALTMLTLPSSRRENRQWQRDFFATHPTLNVERQYLKDRKNTLNLQALQTQPLTPLDTATLGEYMHPPYLEWINNTIARAPQSLRFKKLLAAPASLFYLFPGIHNLPTRFGFDPYTLTCEESRALNAYLVLHPIQTILKMRR